MNVYLIQLTRYLLCVVSMLLTGLFALSFSSTANLSLPFTITGEKFLAPLLMVIVGMGIDLSKYLFWQYRYHSMLFLLISVLLVFFSWAASVAFFLSQEQGNLVTTQKSTRAYQAHQAEIHRRQQTITKKQLVFNTRMESRYHTQWDKATELTEDITALEKQLAELMAKGDTIGLADARKQLSTSAFFVNLAGLFHTSITVVATTAYGVLAALIELCALGAIALAQSVGKVTSKNASVHNLGRGTLTRMQTKQAESKNRKIPVTRPIKPEKKARLQQDILSGRIAPIIRRIKRSGYGLSEENIRKILLELKAQGALVDGGRHLRLAKPVK